MLNTIGPAHPAYPNENKAPNIIFSTKLFPSLFFMLNILNEMPSIDANPNARINNPDNKTILGWCINNQLPITEAPRPKKALNEANPIKNAVVIKTSFVLFLNENAK